MRKAALVDDGDPWWWILVLRFTGRAFPVREEMCLTTPLIR